MSKRRSEQIQQGKGRPAETQVTRTPDASAPAALSNEAEPGEGTTDANVLGKYWIAIVIWVLGFTLMIVFELISALFRR